VSAGTCTIDANQAGDASYGAAPQVQQSFLVLKSVQVITFTSTPPANAIVGGPTYKVKAFGGASGNPVVFSSGSSMICTVSGSTVSFIGAGQCVVDANQAGNSGYFDAPQTDQVFSVEERPLIATDCLTTASVGQHYRCTISAIGAPTPTLTVGKLPPWLTQSSGARPGSVVLSGTPSGPGTVRVKISATNSVGTTHQSIVITVK